MRLPTKLGTSAPNYEGFDDYMVGATRSTHLFCQHQHSHVNACEEHQLTAKGGNMFLVRNVKADFVFGISCSCRLKPLDVASL